MATEAPRRGTASLTLPQAIELAIQYQNAGDFDAARALYAKVLEVDAGNLDALQLRGTLEYQAGDYPLALDFIGRALAIRRLPQICNNLGLVHEALGDFAAAAEAYAAACELKPDYAAAFDHLGDALTLSDRIGEAIAAYREALRLQPDMVTAWSSLGNALNLVGDTAAATAALERALALDPDAPEAHLNLGSIHYRCDRLAEARGCFEQALALAPDFARAHYNLGSLHHREGRLEAAIEAFRRALELEPEDADTHNNLGLALLEMGRQEEGTECLRRVVALRPDSAPMLANLGIALNEAGACEEALTCFERALQLDPDEATARHFVNFARGITTDRPPAGYVRDLFDAYADKFDQQLVGQLEYRTPDRLRAALARHLPGDGTALDILDLGCGTGLLGPLLRPWARRLTGIDLSGGMLRKAAALGVYDELLACDLLDHLAGAADASLDLAAAADVFVYLGDLAPVFAATRRVLRRGGLFAFSVERADVADASYRLVGSGRYRHAPDYIGALSVAHGFGCLEMEAVVLRKDRNVPVDGLIFVLTRAG